MLAASIFIFVSRSSHVELIDYSIIENHQVTRNVVKDSIMSRLTNPSADIPPAYFPVLSL